jgi:DNA-binding response OmpR family regulator
VSRNNSPINIIGFDRKHTLKDELSTLLNPLNYHIRLVHSIEQGIVLMRNFDADVLIISSSLEEEDRLKICRKLKEIYPTPILVLSNSGKPGVVEQTLDAGADEYLLKPISGNLLSAHLNKLTRRFREERFARTSQEHKNNGGEKHDDYKG